MKAQQPLLGEEAVKTFFVQDLKLNFGVLFRRGAKKEKFINPVP